MGIVARQGIYSAVFLFIGFAIGAFNNLVVVQYFDKAGLKEYYGLLQLIIAWSIVFSQFLNFGSTLITVRYSASLKDAGRENEINFYTWIFPIVGITGLGIFLLFFGEWFIGFFTTEVVMDTVFLLLIIFVHTFFMTYTRSLTGVAVIKFKNVSSTFYNEVIIRLLLLLSVVIFYMGWINLTGLFILFALSHALQFIGFFFSLGGFSLFEFKKPETSEIKEKTVYGLYSIFDSSATILINKLDVLMIGAIIGTGDIIYYNFALFMATVMMLPRRSLMMVSSSLVFDHFHNNEMNKIQVLYQKNSLVQLLAGGIIFILIWINIDEILALVRPSFEVVKYPFLFLGLSYLFDLFTSINGLIIQASPYFRFNFYFNGLMVVLAFVTNLLFIPWLAIEGAAIATAIVFFVLNIIRGIFVYSKFKLHPVHPNILLAIICLLIPFGVGYLLPDVFASPLLEIVYKGSVISILFLMLVIVTKVSDDLSNMYFLVMGKLGLKKR
jgi:O-antigen/teichoic acid export membrane protein